MTKIVNKKTKQDLIKKRNSLLIRFIDKRVSSGDKKSQVITEAADKFFLTEGAIRNILSIKESFENEK